jgi:hypothetical protein
MTLDYSNIIGNTVQKCFVRAERYITVPYIDNLSLMAAVTSLRNKVLS